MDNASAAAEPTVLFRPTGPQWAIHERLQRFSVLVCHRGFGKTGLAVNELIRLGLSIDDARLVYLAPFRNQSKAVAWDSLKSFADPIGVEPNESELRVDFPENGSRVQLFGADNAEALRGQHLDAVVLDEFAQMAPEVWKKVIRPALERRNGIAVFIGTPQGRNHFHDLFQFAQHREGWYADFWPASRCGLDCTPPGQQGLTPARLAILREELGEDSYAQEYECSFEAAIVGAYYARQMEQIRAEGRVRVVPVEPHIPVTTFWDLGIDDSTAIIFAQRVGREIHVVDYLEENGKELAYYAREMQRRPYLYEEHVLPHDGGARELGSGKTLAQQLRELLNGARLGGAGRAVVRVLPQDDVAPGIEAARRILSRCWFDAVKCARLVEVLSQYRRDWDSKAQTFKPKARHDWASHGADAFRYLAVGWREPVKTDGRQRYAESARSAWGAPGDEQRYATTGNAW